MKIIFTSIFSLFTFLSFAQVPTQDLIFAHDFASTTAAAVPQGLMPYANDATLGADILSVEESALSLQAGQNMRFYNDSFQAGSSNGQLTVSIKFAADFNALNNMEQNTYASLYNSGDCFIRILKTSTYFIQVGLYNGNNNKSSFGFISLAYNVDPGLISSWTDVSLWYTGTPTSQHLELFYNGQAVVSTTQGYECEQGGNPIYLNYDMVIGGLSDSPFVGSIDEVYIHNRALSSAEIAQIYSSTSFVGVNELNPSTSLNLYPNPAVDVLFIESLSNDIIEIRDVQGALISQQKLQIGINQINTSELAPGIYLVKSYTSTKKFIKA
jgi:hypothetical protein